MPFGARPLEGEHDCRLGLPFDAGSTEEDRELGAPGLPLVAESGLSGSVVLKFGGASSEKPGISEGFHGLDFTVGDVPREGTGFLAVVETGFLVAVEIGFLVVVETGFLVVVETGLLVVVEAGLLFVVETGFLVIMETGFVTEDDLEGGADIQDTDDGVVGRRVGVAALDVDFGAVIVGLAVGVDDLAVDLDNGVEDLDGTVGLAVDVGLVADTVGLLEVNVGLEVGVDGLVGLDAVVNEGRPVGVAGLDPGPPDDDGLRVPAPEEFNPGDETGCLDTKLLLAGSSGWGFANYNRNEERASNNNVLCKMN
ncbi:hypothetical protein TorRG33x02_341700 [Trema orientale]|uniref:Uncharacterized protein n=1 Tax=Trema orientale TaxID=63057 RepID=A0A2P5ATJ2_TREOI|nr:hypothetical protein TorRG33x02_341700 [Trema orientale]